jgi:hypothetical protein
VLAYRDTLEPNSHGVVYWQKHGNCPEGWYITGRGENGMYYNPATGFRGTSQDFKFPESGWQIYRGPYAQPGNSPTPTTSTVSTIRDHM